MPDKISDSETYAIIGAAMEVHKVLGCGFLEGVYQQAFARELATRNIPFKREVRLPILYKGNSLDCSYQADFVCCDNIIVELKALDALSGQHEAQLLNYLKATGYRRGLLLNFGQTSLQYKRRLL